MFWQSRKEIILQSLKSSSHKLDKTLLLVYKNYTKRSFQKGQFVSKELIAIVVTVLCSAEYMGKNGPVLKN